jgi:hypothetical protein
MQSWPAALDRHRLIFGAEPTGLTPPSFQRLIDEQVREAEDLDFKRQHYGRSDKGKYALASDVVAMANDRGGVIVLGVDDEGTEVATALTPVSLDGEQQRWMRQIIASHTAPHVPVELVPVESSGSSELGWLLIVVAPSDRRPHAVTKGDDLRYARRHGATTRLLSEAEVADMYRDRFATARGRTERLAQIMEEGRASVGIAEQPVLEIGLVPTAPGRLSVDNDTVRRVAAWLVGEGHMSIGPARFWRGFFGSTPSVGPRHRRVVASGRRELDGLPYCELHTDGAAYAALGLIPLERHSYDIDDFGEGQLVAEVDLVFGIAQALGLLARHAVFHTGAYGDALVEVRLGSDQPVAVGFVDRFRRGNRFNGTGQTAKIEAEFTVTLDTLIDIDQELLSVTWRIASDILHGFGLTEARTVTRDGAIRSQAIDASVGRGLAEFAQETGVSLDAQPAPEMPS